MLTKIPFIPGTVPANPEPLARFLPPIPEGVASTWLAGRFKPGSWVLDPFGAAPHLAVEIARAGYRVLVAANNPVTRCLLEMAAAPPTKGELGAALAEFAAAHKGDERLEPHIRSLYNSECAQCRQPVMVDYFVWERGAVAPYARVYRCAQCGHSGEYPVTPADVTRAVQFGQSGLHRARALERVASLDDPDRSHAEEALAVYLPRAVYSLFTLINKLDGLTIPIHRKTLIQALLLHACDQGNSLWGHPSGRERPKQLQIPGKFREHNIWITLEQGIDLWAAPEPTSPVPVAVWPDKIEEGAGICLFEGRLKDLAAGLAVMDIRTVVAALPRPNQAFWTLSALWAGWLWGKQGVGPFKSVLRRRRYDWGWHTSALSAALGSLVPVLKPDTPFLGLVGEAEPGFLSAALIAAERAGFELEGIALRVERGHAQLHWRKPEKTPYRATQEKVEAVSSGERLSKTAAELVRQRALNLLGERGQPAPYLLLHAAACSALVEAHALPQIALTSSPQPSTESQIQISPGEVLSLTQAAFKEIFIPRNGFRRFEGSEQSLEVGQWWVTKEEQGSFRVSPIVDRVEIALVRHLSAHPGCTFKELDTAMCTAFPGFHTPDTELVQVCLESYGEQDPPDCGKWRMRSQESATARRTDLEHARTLLYELGKVLGFITQEQTGSTVDIKESVSPCLWVDTDGAIRYIFYIIASAAFGEILVNCEYPPEHSFILLPGSRANLVAYKLHSDPNLRERIAKGWRFIKYRHLRQLVSNPTITREILDEQFALDPLTYAAPQIRLL